MIRLVRNYLFWSYERGSFHYDVMVTMILLFLFVGPIFINFKDKPVPKIPMHTSEVLVREAGSSGNSGRFVYEIRREDLGDASSDTDLRNAMLRLVHGNGHFEYFHPNTGEGLGATHQTGWTALVAHLVNPRLPPDPRHKGWA